MMIQYNYVYNYFVLFFFFFFQAEDGIRDYKVTGVQTCALPISRQRGARRVAGGVAHRRAPTRSGLARPRDRGGGRRAALGPGDRGGRALRSGERRGGEERRSRGAPDHLKKKKER